MFLLFTDSDQGIAIPSGYNKKLLEHFLTFKMGFVFFFFLFFMNYKILAGTVSEVLQNTLVPTVLPGWFSSQIGLAKFNFCLTALICR